MREPPYSNQWCFVACPSGSTNPCEITEFWAQPYWKQPLFDVCDFRVKICVFVLFHKPKQVQLCSEQWVICCLMWCMCMNFISVVTLWLFWWCEDLDDDLCVWFYLRQDDRRSLRSFGYVSLCILFIQVCCAYFQCVFTMLIKRVWVREVKVRWSRTGTDSALLCALLLFARCTVFGVSCSVHRTCTRHKYLCIHCELYKLKCAIILR